MPRFHVLSLVAITGLSFLMALRFALLSDKYLFHHFASFLYARFTPRANGSHFYLVFRESQLAHRYLDNHSGVEIGASRHNPFGLRTINVDYTSDWTVFREEQVKLTGDYARVDVIASGDRLPFHNGVYDFVVSANVLEHFYDPVAVVNEWFRVIRPGGHIFAIIPHRDRTFDQHRDRTSLRELIQRHEQPNPPTVDDHRHYSVWVTEDFLALCRHYNWAVVAWADEDDKVGDGFMVVLQKEKAQQ